MIIHSEVERLLQLRAAPILCVGKLSFQNLYPGLMLSVGVPQTAHSSLLWRVPHDVHATWVDPTGVVWIEATHPRCPEREDMPIVYHNNQSVDSRHVRAVALCDPFKLSLAERARIVFAECDDY